MKKMCVLIGVLGLATGCAKKSSSQPPSSPMAGDADAAIGDDVGAMEPEAPGGLDYDAPASFDDLQAQLDQLDADLSAQGVLGERDVAAGVEPSPKTAQPASRCERICDLRVAICDVSERICALAEEHQDETKYTDACARAEARCEQAAEACDDCSE